MCLQNTVCIYTYNSYFYKMAYVFTRIIYVYVMSSGVYCCDDEKSYRDDPDSEELLVTSLHYGILKIDQLLWILL